MDSQFLPSSHKRDTGITHKRHVERGVLAKAIYMVTNLFEDGEPLKVALRTEAVVLLSGAQSTYESTRLKDMLTLAGDIGALSEVNTKILLEAVDTLKHVQTSGYETIDIRGMFDADSADNTESVAKQDAVEEGEGEEEEGAQKQENLQESDFDHLDMVPDKVHKVTPQKQPVSSVIALDIGARRKKILEVVRSKGQATIHEFIHSIQGCSSKTIQRELTSLVLSGTLKKTGERRWSKYSLR